MAQCPWTSLAPRAANPAEASFHERRPMHRDLGRGDQGRAHAHDPNRSLARHAHQPSSTPVSAVMFRLHLAAAGRDSWLFRGCCGRDATQATMRAAVTGTMKKPIDITANNVNMASITVSVHAASSAPR
jgi:hypothetical protein